MLARYLNAPLLLLLWQVAPIAPRQDDGPVRLAFGGGMGAFTFTNYPGYDAGMSCGEPYAGKAPYSEATPYTSGGAAAEVWAQTNLRVWAAVGGVKDNSMERNGGFGAVQVALEQPRYGVGIGVATLGGLERSFEPSVSLRYGSLDRVSIRADYRQPGAGMGLIGAPRIGIGWNQGRSAGMRALAGITTTPVPDSKRLIGGFVEVGVPLRVLVGKGGITVSGFMTRPYHGNQTRLVGSFLIGGWLQP